MRILAEAALISGLLAYLFYDAVWGMAVLAVFIPLYGSQRKEELKEKKISLSDLLAYPILMLDKNSTTNEFLHRLFQQHQLDLVPEIELTSNDLLIDLARIGLGIAFIPDYCISKESDGIFTLDMNEEMPERSLVIAYNEQLPLSKATQEFLSCFHPVEE